MHTRDDPDPLLAAHRAPKVESPSPATVARTADTAGSDARSMLELQRLAGNASFSRLVAREPAAEAETETGPAGRSPVLDIVGKGGGEPLAPEVRTEMEGRLGADFASVRVHRDAAASASAKAVDAHAYTVGNDVVFRSDRWDPSSSEGKHTLAHELSHVIQQSSGPVDGTPAPGGIQVSSPDDSFERAADRHADAALAGPAPAASAPAAASGAGGPSAQLEAAKPEDELDEDEMTAGTAQREAEVQREPEVQREASPDDELEDEDESAVPGAPKAQREEASEDDVDEEPG